MIIDDLNLVRISVLPDETDSVLIVDSDAVLSHPLSFQAFQVIPWKNCQVRELPGSVQLFEFPLRYASYILKSTGVLSIEQGLGFRTAKRSNHV